MNKIMLAAISLKGGDVGLPTSTANLGDAIANITKLIMGVIGAGAVLAIIAGGILIITSNGEPAKYMRGRQTVTYAVIGLVVALASYAIVSYIGTRFS